jgi:hypothetical protein
MKQSHELLLTVAMSAAEQLAEADPAGGALGASCLARRRAVE